MWVYFFKRLLLLIPTLLGIVTLNFFIIQSVPGGPVEQSLAQFRYGNVDSLSRVNSQIEEGSYAASSHSFDASLRDELNVLYGFDKPLLTRYFILLKDLLFFDLGTSFFKNETVYALILDKLPVSISLGFWSLALIYLISIPLGIKKAFAHGGRFDVYSSLVLVIMYSIPAFLFSIILIVLFAGGSFWQVFPLRGLISSNFDSLSLFDQILDYFWHLVLPILAMTIGGFATLTFLVKNSFLEELNKLYVSVALSKGLPMEKVLYRHVFRNALLIVLSGIPSAILGVLFTSSFLIEIIFSLDGLGLLGFNAVIGRDYPVIFGTLYITTLLSLFIKIMSDLSYRLIDPRIHFGQKV